MIFGIELDKHPSERLTLTEAALLAGVPKKRIRHELEAKVVVPGKAERKRLRFGAMEVFYFRLVSELRFELKKSDRRDLFILITSKKAEQGAWRYEDDRLLLKGSVPAEFRTTELAREVAAHLELFLRGRRRMGSHPEILGGEPVFEGTRLSVHHVGQLVKKGVPESELLEDFPALNKQDLEFARMFVELGRPPGRPRKLKPIRGKG